MIQGIQFMHLLNSQLCRSIQELNECVVFIQKFIGIFSFTLFKADDQRPGNTIHKLLVIQCIFDQSCFTAVQKSGKEINRTSHYFTPNRCFISSMSTFSPMTVIRPV